MDGVFVQPTGVGSEPGTRNWASTVETLIEFEDHPRGSRLSQHTRNALLQVHPDGRARFWGVTDRYRRAAGEMRAGDIVFFTGTKPSRIIGVGRVGVVLNNAAFADTLWDRHPDQGSFSHVYSLAAFQELDFAFGEFRARGVEVNGVYNIRSLPEPAAAAIRAAFATEIASLGADDAPAGPSVPADVQRQPGPRVEVDGSTSHTAAQDPRGLGEAGGTLDELRSAGALVDEESASVDDGAVLDHAERLRRILGGTDSAGVLRAARLEQRSLRASLGLDGDPDVPSECGICGRWVPRRLLVTAHVKPRSECMDDERTDVNVVMPACALGCDALYELGHLSVGADGRIRTSRRLLRPSHLQTLLREMEGRRAPAWTEEREQFFAWHRVNRFLGAMDSQRPAD